MLVWGQSKLHANSTHDNWPSKSSSWTSGGTSGGENKVTHNFYVNFSSLTNQPNKTTAGPRLVIDVMCKLDQLSINQNNLLKICLYLHNNPLYWKGHIAYDICNDNQWCPFIFFSFTFQIDLHCLSNKDFFMKAIGKCDALVSATSTKECSRTLKALRWY